MKWLAAPAILLSEALLVLGLFVYVWADEGWRNAWREMRAYLTERWS